MRSPKPLVVHYVPFLETLPVADAVELLRPHLIAAEKAASRQSVVVLPRKDDYGGVIDQLVKVRKLVTERSYRDAPRAVPVVAYCPTFKGLQVAQRLSSGWLGVVQWPTKWFEGWVQYMGATNAVTGEKFPALSDTAREAIADIEWSGNNGWGNKRDTLTVGQARRGAEKAREAGLTDGHIYGAMLAHGHSEESIERLMSIIGAK